MEKNLQTLNEKRIVIDESVDRSELFGSLDRNLRDIENRYRVFIVQRDDQIIIRGEGADEAEAVLLEMIETLKRGEGLDEQKVGYITELSSEGISYSKQNVARDIVCFTHEGRPIRPKTLGQKTYIEEIRKKDIVFGIGPAGTGKTYLAVAMAVNAFKNREVKRIILARPAVEAGESLGFLPGDLQEKVDPYLRPLYDALYDVMGRDMALRLKEKETIEVVPLAYMRGRTLDNSFIILDEAQNTTPEQMKMFLTRMGFDSKVVVTGDITQIDLPKDKRSGLIECRRILKDVDEISFCQLKEVDVVRHQLVKKVIRAYERYERKK